MASLPTPTIKTSSRIYNSFRGVDFFNETVKAYRSPDSVNMWKNYNSSSKSIETRPGMTKLAELGLEIFGLFFYEVNNQTQVLVHNGTRLDRWNNFPNTPLDLTNLKTGMKPTKSNSFVFNGILFISDGLNYLEYNGETLSDVVGTIPVTTTLKKPNGAGERLNSFNMIQPKRTNEFIGDGTSTEYHLDTTNLDNTAVVAVVDGVTMLETQGFTVDRTNGTVTFETPPSLSADQENNVSITFAKTVQNETNKILNCKLTTIFDNRVFFSGNDNYPNALFWGELEDPRYFGSDNWTAEGDINKVTGLVKGYNKLIVLKEGTQEGSSIITHTPTLDYEVGKVYPSVESNVSVGCIGSAINFRDDVVFLSKSGLESITGEELQERLLTHRSSMVDKVMINTNNYTNAQMIEWKDYLLILADSKIFLADSRATFQDTNEEYEWFYWELPNNITFMKEDKGNLYLGNSDGNLYILNGTTDDGVAINSKWSTPKDSFGYEAYRKTTNKGGCIVVVEPKGANITASVRKNDDELKTIGTYSDNKGYIVLKIKEKKWRTIQLVFSSMTPFSIEEVTLEAFIGGYIKR